MPVVTVRAPSPPLPPHQKLVLEIENRNVNLEARTLSFKINNPAASATLSIYNGSGKTLATVTREFHSIPAGTALEVAWADPGDEIAYMDLKVTDSTGYWKSVRLTPFSVTIPHGDIEFDEDSANIHPDQEPKLAESLALLTDALERHGRTIRPRLYVAGFPEATGSTPNNLTLARNRALAVAEWFGGRGVKIPIVFQAFSTDAFASQEKASVGSTQRKRGVLYFFLEEAAEPFPPGNVEWIPWPPR